jgi:hypothetical protein
MVLTGNARFPTPILTFRIKTGFLVFLSSCIKSQIFNIGN